MTTPMIVPSGKKQGNLHARRRPPIRRARYFASTHGWPEDLFCNVATKLAADYFGVPVSDISSNTRRSPRVARARQAAMYLAHVAFGLKIAEVGTCFGRDRTTVSYACNRIEDSRDDPAVDAALTEMEIAAAIMRGLHTRPVRP